MPEEPHPNYPSHDVDGVRQDQTPDRRGHRLTAEGHLPNENAKLRPYAFAGVGATSVHASWTLRQPTRSESGQGEAAWVRTSAIGAGADLPLGRLTRFAEGRYQTRGAGRVVPVSLGVRLR